MSASSDPSTRVQIGDIAPRFRLPDEHGQPVDIGADDVAGRPVVLLFCPSRAQEATGKHAAALAGTWPRLESMGAKVFAITDRDAAACGDWRRREGLPCPVLSDPEGRIMRGYGAEADVTTFVLRPNQHVLEILAGGDADHFGAAVAAIESLAEQRRPRPMAPHPPVLMVPDVLSRRDCQTLISTYMLQGNTFVEPGHGAKNMKTDYKMRIPEYGRKDRVDHWIVNEQTVRLINDRLQRRLFPEIRKAFQYRITKHERYRIGCYEGERGGEIHGHRDNSEPIVAHRRFAASINLNAEEFEGGELAFPEFGGHRYSPATGEAIVFSSSVLHEPLQVTSGRRFVLLAFLFGDH